MPPKKSTTTTEKPSSKRSKTDSDTAVSKPKGKTASTKSKKLPVPKDFATFQAEAGSHLTLAIGDEKGVDHLAMSAIPKVFTSGSFGWSGNKKAQIPLYNSKDGKKVDVIISINMTIPGTKPKAAKANGTDKKDKSTKSKASSSKTKANGTKASGSKKRKAGEEDEDEEEGEAEEEEDDGDAGKDEESGASSAESESDD